MLNINEVRLLGRLAEDPTFGKGNNGQEYMRIRVITSKSYKDSNDKWQERATGHSVTTFDRYRIQHGRDRLRKGVLVYVEGENVESRREEEGKTVYHRSIMVPIGGKLHGLEVRPASSAGQENGDQRSEGERRKSIPDGPPIDDRNPIDQHGYDDEIPF